MKKILVAVLALGIIFGSGLLVKKEMSNAGEPPIGGRVTAGLFTTDGEPPIGGAPVVGTFGEPPIGG